jgi:hypothetical protein
LIPPKKSQRGEYYGIKHYLPKVEREGKNKTHRRNLSGDKPHPDSPINL